MTSPILFAGGEDLSFNILGAISGVGPGNPANTLNTWTVDTISGHFRSGWARNAVTIACSAFITGAVAQSVGAFSSANFWTSARMWSGAASGLPSGSSSAVVMRWSDASGIPRLLITANGTNPLPGNTVRLQKIDAAGTVTTLMTTSGVFGQASPSTPDKIDVFINYAVSGTFSVYSNGILIGSYSGDVTTNSVTALAHVELGPACTANNGGGNGWTAWSEVICATQDTRSFGLLTQVATANGATHNWDGGTAAAIAAASYTTSDLSPNFSGTSGQIQEYQVTPAVPVGSFAVISVVQHARALIGSTGPTKFDFMVRTAATDFTSTPDVAPVTAWATYVTNWDNNPNTTVPWLTTELVASSTAYNFGVKSVT